MKVREGEGLMGGEVGILNVGCGDVKLTFDRNNPAECIRAARIVKDMLRRGYALLVEVTKKDGTKTYQRVKEFKDDTYEYIVADFDPIEARKHDSAELDATMDAELDAIGDANEQAAAQSRPAPNGKRRTRAIKATDAKAVAVARTAGG